MKHKVCVVSGKVHATPVHLRCFVYHNIHIRLPIALVRPITSYFAS